GNATDTGRSCNPMRRSSGKEVIARTDLAQVVGTRVASAEIHQSQLRVDGWGLPDGATTMRVCLCFNRAGVARPWPGVRGDIAWSGHSVEAPDLLAGLLAWRKPRAAKRRPSSPNRSGALPGSNATTAAAAARMR